MIQSFYLASSRDQIDDVRDLAAWLTLRRMLCRFPWWDHFDHVCSLEHCGIRDRKHLAAKELDAASFCDLFVGIARMGKGSHVELGARLAAGSGRTVLVGVEPIDSVFYGAAHVEHVADLSELKSLLRPA